MSHSSKEIPVIALLLMSLLAGCGLVGTGGSVVGYPDVDLGAEVVVYRQTAERDLHLHIFEPNDDRSSGDASGRSAVLFFHGGGFATTRVEQFERQAQLVADAGMVGIVVEYRVTAEGTTRNDAIDDGASALEYVRANADTMNVDPNRVAMAGASAGGALATGAAGQVGPAEVAALVLFNPAVNAASAEFIGDTPAIVFHSREDTIVEFSVAEGFCETALDCSLVAFDEGDHGFFNDEPAFTETVDGMLTFLRDLGWV